MKLALAQYRELESFAQFGSDLDEQTRKLLEHGEKSIELLKQNQYEPIPVAKQVVAIYALNNGFLDELPKEQIREWERGLYIFLDEVKSELLVRIEKEWNDEVKAEIEEALKEYNQQFFSEHSSEVQEA